MNATIFDKVKYIIMENLGVEATEVKPEATFDELGADSLDKVELSMEFENAFFIKISDEEMETIKTVQDAVTIIENKK